MGKGGGGGGAINVELMATGMGRQTGELSFA